MHNLAALVLEAQNRSSTPVLIRGSDEMSAAELAERTAATAAALRAEGIGAGDVIGIALRDPVEALVTLMAIWSLGATACPVDFRAPAETRATLAQRFDFAALLADRDLGPEDAARVITGLSASAARMTTGLTPVGAPEAPALITMTSGTTGTPAASIISHDAQNARAAAMRAPDHAQMLTRLLSAAPLSFIGALGPVLSCLINGDTVIPLPPMLRPKELHAAFATHRATGLVAVPTVFRDLLAHCEAGAGPLGTAELRPWIVVHAARSSPEELAVMQRAMTPNIIQMYGASPVGAISSMAVGRHPGKDASVGRPMTDIELEILDDEGNPVPPGQPGRIRISSPGLASELVGRGRGDGGDHISDGYYYAGDIGVLDEDGFLFLVGRLGEAIQRGGVTIYPAEVEAALRSLPEVLDVAVIGIAAERLGEDLAAALVLADGVTLADVTEAAKRVLVADKRPRVMGVVDRIPLNRNGKPNRRALTALFAEHGHG